MAPYIRQWAIRNNITHSALNELLTILRKNNPLLPKDARTLLQTKRESEVKQMGQGQYVYFGLAKYISQLSTTANISLNIDGMPLHNSTNKQFWPILASVDASHPVVICVYYGESKPELNAFMNDFIHEVNDLGNKIVIKNFICDSPARAFIKAIKAPNGYYSCERCVVRGEYVDHIISFNSEDSPLRTNESFRLQSDANHHKDVSPLTKLPIDMLKCFPYDPMHLVFLGVVRRLLQFWLDSSYKDYKLPSRMINAISSSLSLYACNFPFDFSRKPRSLQLFKRWKATEFRTFLLYTGIVALKDCVGTAVYKNFLLLHSAIFILCSPLYCISHCEKARQYLQHFLSTCKYIYGNAMLVYNVHALLHLCDDVLVHGPLDHFSAFQFENKLGLLKRYLRTGHQPLSQLENRLSETSDTLLFQDDFPLTHKGLHSLGPVLHHGVGCFQYHRIFFHRSRLDTNSGDSYVMDKSNWYYKIVNIVFDSKSTTFLICKRFLKQSPFYSYPLESNLLGISFVSQLSEPMSLKLSNVAKKCLCLPYKEGFVMLPMFSVNM